MRQQKTFFPLAGLSFTLPYSIAILSVSSKLRGVCALSTLSDYFLFLAHRSTDFMSRVTSIWNLIRTTVISFFFFFFIVYSNCFGRMCSMREQFKYFG